jgi:hypothetical protein
MSSDLMAVIGAWPRDLALEIGLSLLAADAEVKGEGYEYWGSVRFVIFGLTSGLH